MPLNVKNTIVLMVSVTSSQDDVLQIAKYCWLVSMDFMSPFVEIMRLGNFSINKFNVAFAMWHVAPFHWNHMSICISYNFGQLNVFRLLIPLFIQLQSSSQSLKLDDGIRPICKPDNVCLLRWKYVKNLIPRFEQNVNTFPTALAPN